LTGCLKAFVVIFIYFSIDKYNIKNKNRK